MADINGFKFKDTSYPGEERIADLINRLTIEEKASLMLHQSKAIPRLGIKEYNWWNEALHGLARTGQATVFPQAIGLAATFDRDLIFKMAVAISDEARAKFHATVKGDEGSRFTGLTFWSPNINIFRDPRWGRGQETYGEDPYLTGEMGKSFVKGMQGDHPEYLKTAACAKHFAVHSGPEEKRHEFNAIAGKKDMYETYLPAFKVLVDAGVESVMGAYNRTNGEPCCGSKTLIIDLLRGDWQFKGHYVSDCWALKDFHTLHNVTSSPVESVALAIKNGCDLNCGCTYEFIVEAVKEGMIQEEEVNTCLTRILRTLFKLGLYDPPEQVPFASISKEVIDCAAHRALAREAAEKSIVLLKNENNILPLTDVKSIYIVGPTATNVDALLANYCGLNSRLVTFLEGITGTADTNITVNYSKGCLLDRKNSSVSGWTFEGAARYDVVIACFGLDPTYEGEEGATIATPEKGDRVDLSLPEHQEEYLRSLKEHCKKLILVLTGGSPIIFPEDIADAVLFTWYPGEEGGNALANILLGKTSPSGKLPITFPASVEDLPDFEDYSMKGRTYRYSEKKPLYPFGFGLTYTRFEYSKLTLSSTKISRGEGITASAVITNKGSVTSEEVVQLYIKNVAASVPVPRYALKQFMRIKLTAGESLVFQFELTPEMLEIVDMEGKRKTESGEIKFFIGSSSPDERNFELGSPGILSGSFRVM